jgi:meiotic recombination protein SPO11
MSEASKSLESIASLVLQYISALSRFEDPAPTLLGCPALLSRGPHGDFSGARSHLMLLRTLGTSHELLSKQRTASVRELYYLHASLMEDSGEAADAIAAAQRAMGGVSRHSLGLFASGRGSYAGLVRVGGLCSTASASGSHPRSRSHAHPILNDVVSASAGLAPSGARFLLVVEKAAIFTRLVEDRVWERPGLECALITGCGQPDLATRAFLRQLVDAHPPGTPVLGLVDYNPFGLGILLTYAHGSKAHPEAAPYAVPELAWLGLRGADLDAHALPASVMQPLCTADERRAEGLLRDPHVRGSSSLRAEVERWVEDGVKTELEALMARGVEYLVDVFLPQKLGGGGRGGAQAGEALDLGGIDALPLGGVAEALVGEGGGAMAQGAPGGAAASAPPPLSDSGGGEWDWVEEGGGGAGPASAAAAAGAAPASSGGAYEEEFDF